MKKLAKLGILVGAILVFCQAGYSLTCEVKPREIDINLFYHGEEVTISGKTASDTKILVKISSPKDAEIFMQKGKVKGVFWMNVKRLIFKNIPRVYFIFSSDNSPSCGLNEKEKQRYGIGYAILKNSFEVSPVQTAAERDALFKELIKFKTKEHLWGELKNQIQFSPINEKEKIYKLLIDWSSNIPPNIYWVDVYAIKDGVVVDHVQNKIEVKKARIVKTLSDLAENNGALYGIISILVALSAGIITGIIFKKK